MPTLSLILPVYNVEAYLRQCLDSILDQAPADAEVIVVDDASTDNSRRIAREYARADERVKFIRLPRNGGLGNARNVGLDNATGEFVMFVDSDDWLAEGAIPAILQRIEETDPDVLIYDFARVHWRGKVKERPRREVFNQPGPEIFTLQQRPEILSLLWVAWTKVYRREFIEGLGIRFYKGLYEDVPWTFPILMSAGKITLLDRVCYYYRQRRHGAITKTNTRAHFDILDQYSRVFDFIDAHPDLKLDGWRPVMRDRAANQFLIVLRKRDHRLPPESRREFFSKASTLYRRFASHHVRSNAPLPAKDFDYLALRYNAFTLYEAHKLWLRFYRRFNRRYVQRTVRKLTRMSTKVRARAMRVAYRAFRQLPIDPNLALFAAYWYRGYSCNPQAIYEKMRELRPKMRGVWVVNKKYVDDMPDGVDYVVAGTLQYYMALARAKYLINNVNYPNDIVKRRGTIHVQTFHGTTLKTMGMDMRGRKGAQKPKSMKKMMRRTDRWDYAISSNHYSTEVWRRAFPANYTMLEYGYPRNDVLVTATEDDRQRLRKELGIPPDKVAILYAPTFRDYQKKFEQHLDIEGFARTLADDYVLLTRHHYFYSNVESLKVLQDAGTIIDVSTYPSVQELCIASDVLITDYSSIQFDYANLNRPIVIYADDWDVYTSVRGVNFDLLSNPPGAVATTEEELVEIFREGSYDTPETRRLLRKYRWRFCEFDDGRAAERVVKRVFMGKKVKPTVPLKRRERQAQRRAELDAPLYAEEQVS